MRGCWDHRWATHCGIGEPSSSSEPPAAWAWAGAVAAQNLRIGDGACAPSPTARHGMTTLYVCHPHLLTLPREGRHIRIPAGDQCRLRR